jgi:hypothetical protein
MSGIAQHPPRKHGSHPRRTSAGHDGARTNLPRRDRSARQSSPSAASGGGNHPPVMPTNIPNARARPHRLMAREWQGSEGKPI